MAIDAGEVWFRNQLYKYFHHLLQFVRQGENIKQCAAAAATTTTMICYDASTATTPFARKPPPPRLSVTRPYDIKKDGRDVIGDYFRGGFGDGTGGKASSTFSFFFLPLSIFYILHLSI